MRISLLPISSASGGSPAAETISKRRSRVPFNYHRRNRIMGPVNLEKVLEKLAATEKTTIVIEREPEGKCV
jgi:hypothetical protein